MDIHDLAQKLRDPDPRVRVESLRVLAMLEETRALDAIRWIYKHDPEPGVRAVANWAGQLVWEAHKRGHSTQRAVEEMFERRFSSDLQERFLQTLEFDMPPIKAMAAKRYAARQAYDRQLNELFTDRDDDLEPTDPDSPVIPALPPPSLDDLTLGFADADTSEDLDDALMDGLEDLPLE